MSQERKRRSIAKVISWRFTATLTTVIISYIVIGDTTAAMQIGVVEVFAKMALQYFHERIWSRIKFGLPKPMDYQI